MFATWTCPIMHLICPSKFWISIVFNFCLDGCNTRRNEEQCLCKNGGGGGAGAKKVHYGKCANGEYRLMTRRKVSASKFISPSMNELMIFLLLFTSLLAWRTLKFLIYYLRTKKPILKSMTALPCLSLIFSWHIFLLLYSSTICYALLKSSGKPVYFKVSQRGTVGIFSKLNMF